MKILNTVHPLIQLVEQMVGITIGGQGKKTPEISVRHLFQFVIFCFQIQQLPTELQGVPP